MLEALAFALAAVAVIVVVQVLADKTGLPAAALLTVSGLTSRRARVRTSGWIRA